MVSAMVRLPHRTPSEPNHSAKRQNELRKRSGFVRYGVRITVVAGGDENIRR